MKALSLTVFAASVAFTAFGSPGDPEVACNGSRERWLTSGPIPWEVTYTTNAGIDTYTGGGPPLNTFSAAMPVPAKPGIATLVAAAGNWNKIAVPDAISATGQPISSSGAQATTISFSQSPTLALRTLANFPGVAIPTYTYIPPPPPVVCCFGLFRTQVGVTTTMPDTMVQNSRNTIDFVGNGIYWNAVLGLPTNALAIGMVWLAPASTTIVEFDVGFNACPFYYSFVTNCSTPGFTCWNFVQGGNYGWLHDDPTMLSVLGQGGGTTTFAAGSFVSTWNVPRTAFADVGGVLTHELGHALGLGHSYQTGKANLRTPASDFDVTEFPTMYPDAQASRLEEAYDYSARPFQNAGEVLAGNWSTAIATDPTTWPPSVMAQVGIPRVRGVLGVSASSLELDDVAAIGRNYPTTEFQTLTGRIFGTVLLGGQPYVGAHVTAFHASYPDTIRASCLTYQNGTYDLQGLPPGRYYLRVEQFPDEIAPGVEPGFFYCPSSTNVDFPAELWNANDAAVESARKADIIGVAAGVGFQADFVLEVGSIGTWTNPVLSVRNATATPSGTGGILAPVAPNRRQIPIGDANDSGNAGANFNVELRIDGTPAHAFAPFAIIAAPRNTMQPRFGQLFTVVADPDVIPTTSFSGTLDANGDWQGLVPIAGKAAVFRDNIQFEAVVYASAGGTPTRITNAASAWFWF